MSSTIHRLTLGLCPRLFPALVILIFLGSGIGCVHRVIRKTVEPAQMATLDHKSPYLKVHYKSGNLAVINQWSVDESHRMIEGTGHLLSPSRDTLSTGHLVVPLDSVALFETNVVQTSPSVVSMAVLTGVSAALTVICISSPKTCFGSCPTFYWSDGSDSSLVAEGFSSSVAPSLEKTDIDALWNVRPWNNEIRLRLTNEALETHVIRQAVLLAVPKPAEGRVVKTRDGRFFDSPRQWEPIAASDSAGSCLELVRQLDHRERFSPADSFNLASKEIIECTFAPVSAGPVGLVIGCRQTLLSTYLFYQSLAYMGTRASEFLSKLEQGNSLAIQAATGPGRYLGEIEVQIMQPDGSWEAIDSTMETGPLATDVVVVPLTGAHGDTVRTRLLLNKGHWRIDYLALAQIGQEVRPERIEPSAVFRDGTPDNDARDKLSSDSSFLVTMPGDRYDLFYHLSDHQAAHCEYFLESRGYYLEWMRQEWLAEENLGKMALMFANPAGYLKSIAPEYKQVESGMEDYFWGSRFAH